MTNRRTQTELSAAVGVAAKQVVVGGHYMHYKQRSYTVVSLAILEATTKVAVVYQAEYGDHLIFIRALDDWLETVEWQGTVVPRFRFIDTSNHGQQPPTH